MRGKIIESLDIVDFMYAHLISRIIDRIKLNDGVL